MGRIRPARAAIVHEYFIQDGGAERCAVEFARLLPQARVFTTFYDEPTFGDRISPGRIHTWPPQRLLGATRHFRALLPLYPIYFSALDLREFDLVLSSSIAFSKAVRTRRGALHVSYVYTPVRYAWDLDTYLQGSSYGRVARLGAMAVRKPLRWWDHATAGRPNVVVAISETVQDRIRTLWKRDSQVIYPPVDVDEVQVSGRDDGYLLVAARMLAYRRLDLVVEACSRLNRRLVVVGDGPERQRLEAMGGSATTFLGHVERPVLLDLFARCSAYVVPGVEDFGIAPVEAMAAGKPVIAFRGGGVRETVVDGQTGVFFDEPEPDSLIDAIGEFDRTRFDRDIIRTRAELFDRRVFLDRWRRLFERLGVDPTLYSPE